MKTALKRKDKDPIRYKETSPAMGAITGAWNKYQCENAV